MLFLPNPFTAPRDKTPTPPSPPDKTPLGDVQRGGDFLFAQLRCPRAHRRARARLQECRGRYRWGRKGALVQKEIGPMSSEQKERARPLRWPSSGLLELERP